MRSGAWPTTRIPRTCRPRARQELHIKRPIIALGTESGLGPLQKHCTCRPRAWPIARTEGTRTKTAPEAPSPRTPHFRHTSRAGRARGPGAWNLDLSSPLPLLSRFSMYFKDTGFTTCLYPQARHAGPRGRRTSPACGSCRRPLKKCENQGIEESNGGKKK